MYHNTRSISKDQYSTTINNASKWGKHLFLGWNNINSLVLTIWMKVYLGAAGAVSPERSRGSVAVGASSREQKRVPTEHAITIRPLQCTIITTTSFMLSWFWEDIIPIHGSRWWALFVPCTVILPGRRSAERESAINWRSSTRGRRWRSSNGAIVIRELFICAIWWRDGKENRERWRHCWSVNGDKSRIEKREVGF